jgi:hypothetical protein
MDNFNHFNSKVCLNQSFANSWYAEKSQEADLHKVKVFCLCPNKNVIFMAKYL